MGIKHGPKPIAESTGKEDKEGVSLRKTSQSIPD